MNLRIIFLTVFILTAAMLVHAQASRTWVSGVGDDANPCSRTAPCKTFAGAYPKTATTGEINCLDSGGFGALTISKNLTIDCTGYYADVLVGTNLQGITINGANIYVRLRGLSVNGMGAGAYGIRILAAARVTIEDTIVDGCQVNGISVETTATFALFVSNSTIRNNAGVGINVVPGGGTPVPVTGAIFMSSIYGNSTGIMSQTSDIAVSNCLISANGNGIYASNNGTVRISGNTISENINGLTIQPKGAIASYSNNAISGNTTNGSPSSQIGLQ